MEQYPDSSGECNRKYSYMLASILHLFAHKKERQLQFFQVEACVNAEANIVNMSLGGGGSSEIGRMAYKRMYEEDNVLLIAAAGNDGNAEYSYPASYETVLSVAAIDSNKNITSFSQKNDQVNIAAPGVSVRSTLPGNA